MPRNLILSVNAGSSSLKISVFKPAEGKEPVSLVLTSNISNIYSNPTLFAFEPASDAVDVKRIKKEQRDSIVDHKSAFTQFLDALEQYAPFDKNDILHVCHRVVHGGSYTEPVVICEETYHHIEELSDLAPLHNGAALAVIKICLDALPDANSIAFFDTSFHKTIPEYVSTYLIDPEIAKTKGLKKYGFHGLSYAYILRAVAAHLQKPLEDTTVVIMHLGSGASVCAVKDGKSIDTSMGLTPVEGLPGATRSGGVDPSMIFHYTSEASKFSHSSTSAMRITEAEEILNKQSGWKIITGTTDFRAITQKAFAPESSSKSSEAPLIDTNPYLLAFQIFADRVLNFVGSYFRKVGGSKCIDAIVFSGGIGERSVELRKAVCDGVECFGFELDEKSNESVDEGENAEKSVVDIGVKTSVGDKMRILVCRTDEQFEMARECALKPEFE